MRERVASHLYLIHFRIGIDPTFAVEVGAGPGSGPDASPLPTGIGVIDPSVEILNEEAERIRNAQIDEFSVHQREHGFAAVGGGERHVRAQPQDVVAIDPYIIGVISAAVGIEPFELRTGHPVHLPALRALLAFCGSRSVERALAELAIEACEVTTGQRRPNHAVETEIPMPQARSSGQSIEMRRSADYRNLETKGATAGRYLGEYEIYALNVRSLLVS